MFTLIQVQMISIRLTSHIHSMNIDNQKKRSITNSRKYSERKKKRTSYLIQITTTTMMIICL